MIAVACIAILGAHLVLLLGLEAQLRQRRRRAERSELLGWAARWGVVPRLGETDDALRERVSRRIYGLQEKS